MLKRKTCHELLILLGFDQAPSAMVVMSVTLTTAFEQLTAEAKADIVQHLSSGHEARALWAVRVLDAWAGDWGWACPHMTDIHTGKRAGYLVRHGDQRALDRELLRETRDAARLAAAERVFPGLDESDRARLGERP